jgi:hypothetical protein
LKNKSIAPFALVAELLMLKTATSLGSTIFRLNWLELLGWAHNAKAQTMEIPIATAKSGIENSRNHFITLPLPDCLVIFLASHQKKSEKNRLEDYPYVG